MGVGMPATLFPVTLVAGFSKALPVALQQGFSDSTVQGTPMMRLLRGDGVTGDVERAAQKASVVLRHLLIFLYSLHFPLLEHYTSSSDLAAVTLWNTVTGSILSDSFRHFNSPSADSHGQRAWPVGVLSILGRWK